ncbi:MAG: RHS repeat-associated core domain-containing protein, partial [Mariniblastus sp.]
SSVTDATGAVTTYQRDDDGRVSAIVDAGGVSTEYSYDSAGRLAGITQGDSLLVRSYDERGRLESVTNPDGSSIQLKYDSFDRLIERNTIDTGGNSQIETFTYDEQDIIAVADARGESTYSYDDKGRLKRRDDANGSFIAYTYDNLDRTTSIETPGGLRSYSYIEETGQIASVTSVSGKTTSFTYDGRGRLETTTRFDGSVETVTYDQFGNVRMVETSDGNDQVIDQIVYQFDEFSRLISKTALSGATTSYRYDVKDQLVFEEHASDQLLRSRQYRYDNAGNRIELIDSLEGTTTYAYGEHNQLIEMTTETEHSDYSYDENGQLVESISTDGTTIQYHWDSVGRLVEIVKSKGSETSITGYEYDAFGGRVATIVDGVRTEHLIDYSGSLSRVVETLDADGNVIEATTFAQRPIEVHGISQSHQIVSDIFGDSQVLINNDGIRTGAGQYFAFGAPIGTEGDSALPSFYRGEKTDLESGLISLRARFLDPTTGRFLSRDTSEGDVGIPVTHHDYLYASNDPINSGDPTGLVSSLVETVVTNVLQNRLFQVGIAQFLVGLIGRELTGSVLFSGPTYEIETAYTGDFSLGLGLFTHDPNLVSAESTTIGVVTLAKELLPDAEFSTADSLGRSASSSKAKKLRSRAKDSVLSANKKSKKKARSAAKKDRDQAKKLESLGVGDFFSIEKLFGLSGGDADIYAPGLFNLGVGAFVGTYTTGSVGGEASFFTASAASTGSGGYSLAVAAANYGFSAGYTFKDTGISASVATKTGKGKFDLTFSASVKVGVSLPFSVE